MQANRWGGADRAEGVDQISGGEEKSRGEAEARAWHGERTRQRPDSEAFEWCSSNTLALLQKQWIWMPRSSSSSGAELGLTLRMQVAPAQHFLTK
eukprot:2528864-Pleurochrysis_carterae.AAC.4